MKRRAFHGSLELQMKGERQTDRQTGTERERERERQRQRQTDRQTNRQTANKGWIKQIINGGYCIPQILVLRSGLLVQHDEKEVDDH